jgi:hypothetical protein
MSCKLLRSLCNARRGLPLTLDSRSLLASSLSARRGRGHSARLNPSKVAIWGVLRLEPRFIPGVRFGILPSLSWHDRQNFASYLGVHLVDLGIAL